ncbi:MAG: hypothetical protein WC323_04210, partial [Patescibacteria group bacterium]
KQLGEAVKTNLPKTTYHVPNLKYTTDNAAMIAAAGYFAYKYKSNIETKWDKIRVDCNLSL